MAPVSPSLDRAGLDELLTFATIARLGTMRATAAELGLTQPSISARLATLEESWGQRLFYRRARGMELTPEGERLLPLTREALGALLELDRLAGGEELPDTALRLGAGDALGRELLPRALQGLRAERPKLQVRVVEGGTARLLEALRKGDIDLALVAGEEGEEPGRDFDAVPLLESAVEALVPAAWPSSRRALASRPLVLLHQDSSFRRHVERALADQHLPTEAAVEVGSLSLVRRYVEAGLGWAPVPAVAFGATLGPELRRRARPDLGRIRYLRVTRRGFNLSEPALELVERL